MDKGKGKIGRSRKEGKELDFAKGHLFRWGIAHCKLPLSLPFTGLTILSVFCGVTGGLKSLVGEQSRFGDSGIIFTALVRSKKFCELFEVNVSTNFEGSFGPGSQCAGHGVFCVSFAKASLWVICLSSDGVTTCVLVIGKRVSE